MFKNLLQTEQTMEILGIVSLIIFLLIFIYILYITFRLDKKYVDQMGNMPLEDNKSLSNKNKE